MARWTQEEVNYLKENAEYGNYQDIADDLERSYCSVRCKAQDINLKTRIKWDKNKIKYLKENYPDKGDKEIAQELGCTEKAVKLKRQELGIVNEHLWTDEEEQFIQDNWSEMSDKEIANKLNRSVNYIRNRRHKKLDIYRPDNHCGMFNNGIHWTEEKEEFLKNNFDCMKFEEISDKFGISYQAVRNKAAKLGLEKQEKWTEQETKFLKNNWQSISDHEIAVKLNKSLTSVKQKRSKRLNLIREDPTGTDYKWREWEKKCEEIAQMFWEDVQTQYTFDNGLRADIYLPGQKIVVEVKWSYYKNWGAEKYLSLDKVENVIVWSYHEVPANSCSLPVIVRHDLINRIENQELIKDIKEIKNSSVHQSSLETVVEY